MNTKNSDFQDDGLPQSVVDKVNSGIARFNQTVNKAQDTLRCDTDCQRRRDIAELKRKWMESKAEYKRLPDEINSFEKQYFILDKGAEYYRNNILRKRYEEYINKFEKDQLAKFADMKALMNVLLENYTSETNSNSRINQLYDDISKKNQRLKKDIDTYYKRTFTGERRVYYENDEMDNIQFYKRMVQITYYLLLVVYMIFGSFFHKGDYKHLGVWIIIVIYVAIPFLLKYIMNWILD